MSSIIIVIFLVLRCILGEGPKSLDGWVDLVHSHLQDLVLRQVLGHLLRFLLAGESCRV